MRKQVYICDHCGTEFNPNGRAEQNSIPMDGYADIDINDFDFCAEVDLCTNCYNKLCDMVKKFISRVNEK